MKTINHSGWETRRRLKVRRRRPIERKTDEALFVCLWIERRAMCPSATSHNLHFKKEQWENTDQAQNDIVTKPCFIPSSSMSFLLPFSLLQYIDFIFSQNMFSLGSMIWLSHIYTIVCSTVHRPKDKYTFDKVCF